MPPPPSQIPPKKAPAPLKVPPATAATSRVSATPAPGQAEAGAPRMLEHLNAVSPLTSAFSLLALSLPEVEAPSLDELAVELPAPTPLPEGEALKQLLEGRLRDVLASAAERTALAQGEGVKEGDEVLLETLGFVGERPIPDTAREGLAVRVEKGAGPGGLFGLVAGRKVGERVDVEVTLPQDFATRELAGARARFTLRILQAQRVGAPVDAGNPAVLARLGLGASREQALKVLAEGLQAEFQQSVMLSVQGAVMQAFASQVKAPIPPALVDEDIRQYWQRTEGRVLEKQGAPEAQRHASLEAVRTSPPVREQSERRLRLGLALKALIRQDHLRLTPRRLADMVGPVAPGFWLRRPEIARALEGEGPLTELVRTAHLLAAVEYVLAHAQVRFQEKKAESGFIPPRVFR